MDSGLVGRKVFFDHHIRPVGEVSRGEEIALRGTDPESYISEYSFIYEDKVKAIHLTHFPGTHDTELEMDTETVES